MKQWLSNKGVFLPHYLSSGFSDKQEIHLKKIQPLPFNLGFESTKRQILCTSYKDENICSYLLKVTEIF